MSLLKELAKIGVVQKHTEKIKEGDCFILNTEIIKDEELLRWYSLKPSNILCAVEVTNDVVWVKHRHPISIPLEYIIPVHFINPGFKKLTYEDIKNMPVGEYKVLVIYDMVSTWDTFIISMPISEEILYIHENDKEILCIDKKNGYLTGLEIKGYIEHDGIHVYMWQNIKD